MSKDGEGIPDAVRRFILTSVPTVPFLEAMLVHRAAAGNPVSARDVAKRLYLPESSCATLQESLRDAGIVSALEGVENSYRFAPASTELARMLDELAALYAKDLIGVTRIIHSSSGRKAQQFADAFKWRKDS